MLFTAIMAEYNLEVAYSRLNIFTVARTIELVVKASQVRVTT